MPAQGPKATATHDAPTPCELLIVDALVLCLDADDTILPRGAVAIDDGKVVAVGASATIQERFTARETIAANDRVVMPGFVNPHNHTPLMLVRGMIEDLNFAPAYTPSIPHVHDLGFDDSLALARVGVYELLRAGVTTVVDYYRHPRAIAQAAEELGIRAVVGGRIHDADTATLAQGRYEHRREVGEATLAETLDLIETYQGRGHGRIRCDFAPHAADTCSAELLTQVAEYAERYGGNIHTHLAQSRKEVQHVLERDGRRPHQALADAGLLDDRLIAAHSVFLEPEDIDAVGAAGVTIAHAPHQNGRAGNIAPILDLAAAGARITLCTDTRSADMFEAMRLAIACARIRGEGMEPQAPSALRWATVNGADSLHLPDVTGTIEPGAKADVILLDRDSPNLVPLVDGYGILVHSGQSLNVQTVIVDGEPIIRDGMPTAFDGAAIAREAQQVAARLWRDQSQRRAVTETP